MNRTVFIFREKPDNSPMGRIVVSTSVGGRLCWAILHTTIFFSHLFKKTSEGLRKDVDIPIFQPNRTKFLFRAELVLASKLSSTALAPAVAPTII